MTMNTTLISQAAGNVTELSKELLDVLEYYDTIDKILEETYKALGENRIVEVSTSLAANNMKIDDKSFGSISPVKVSSGLA